MYSKILQYASLILILSLDLTKSLTIKDVFLENHLDSENFGDILIRMPRESKLRQTSSVLEESSISNSKDLKQGVVPFVRVVRRAQPDFPLPFKELNELNQIHKELNNNKQSNLRYRRQAENNKFYSRSYSSTSSSLDRPERLDINKNINDDINGEDNRRDKNGVPLEKRCISCMSGYLNKPYSYDRYDGYGSRYNGYYDDYNRPYDRYDRNRYDQYDRYDNRDRYYDRYDDYDSRDPYYGSSGSGSYGRSRGRYGGTGGYRDRYSDRYDPYYDRGLGYDNRGYDDYRPYDDNLRSYTSGYGSISRGYNSRPDYYAYGYASNVGDYDGRGGGYGSGSGSYARDYAYSGSGTRDDYRDRYGGSSQYNGGYGGSRSRDPYNDSQYRYTSYLYDRPSSSTTQSPQNDNDSNTSNPSQDGSG